MDERLAVAAVERMPEVHNTDLSMVSALGAQLTAATGVRR